MWFSSWEKDKLVNPPRQKRISLIGCRGDWFDLDAANDETMDKEPLIWTTKRLTAPEYHRDWFRHWVGVADTARSWTEVNGGARAA
ncbi:hypothetical protein N7450_008201 [Penicillium hetheringtonii]|uniref:Uncharacterized protein n=1 Tax=Penicillium hetheringtonii TaxID=911720 RepID=A0AAD6GPN8_9EURO|nr:hypothetical protein N7450_008201 [Penicillium hetheringtonii]